MANRMNPRACLDAILSEPRCLENLHTQDLSFLNPDVLPVMTRYSAYPLPPQRVLSPQDASFILHGTPRDSFVLDDSDEDSSIKLGTSFWTVVSEGEDPMHQTPSSVIPSPYPKDDGFKIVTIPDGTRLRLSNHTPRAVLRAMEGSILYDTEGSYESQAFLVADLKASVAGHCRNQALYRLESATLSGPARSVLNEMVAECTYYHFPPFLTGAVAIFFDIRIKVATKPKGIQPTFENTLEEAWSRAARIRVPKGFANFRSPLFRKIGALILSQYLSSVFPGTYILYGPIMNDQPWRKQEHITKYPFMVPVMGGVRFLCTPEFSKKASLAITGIEYTFPTGVAVLIGAFMGHLPSLRIHQLEVRRDHEEKVACIRLVAEAEIARAIVKRRAVQEREAEEARKALGASSDLSICVPKDMIFAWSGLGPCVTRPECICDNEPHIRLAWDRYESSKKRAAETMGQGGPMKVMKLEGPPGGRSMNAPRSDEDDEDDRKMAARDIIVIEGSDGESSL